MPNTKKSGTDKKNDSGRSNPSFNPKHKQGGGNSNVKKKKRTKNSGSN